MSEPTAYAELVAAVGGEETEPVAGGETTSTESTAAPETPTETTQEPPAQRPDDIINDPRVQQAIDNARRAGEYRVQQQLQEQVQQNIIQNLPDDEYGRYVRQQQMQQAQLTQIQEQIAAGFYTEAWSGVTQVLNKEKISQDKWPDPRKYQTFADLMDAVNEVVADARANKLAEQKANQLLETKLAEERAKLYAEYPRQPTLQGGAPVRPGEVPQNLKPMDLLRHALS